MHASLVVLRQKLRLVRGHIHLHRALRFARLAAQAQIERLVHRLALESLRVQRSGQHLPQQMRSAARGVLLVARRTIARTHHAAVRLPARTHSDAAFRCRLQRSAIPRKRKMRSLNLPMDSLIRAFFLARTRRRRLAPPQVAILQEALPQVFDRIVDTHRIDQLARDSCGCPDPTAL